MANVVMTTAFSDLPYWSGELLSGAPTAQIFSMTSTGFGFKIPVGQTYAGYRVIVTGTGFAYDGRTPIAGTMNKVTFQDPTGHVILSVDGLASNPVSADFALFASHVMGWTNPNGSVNGPFLSHAWSMMLSGNDVITGTSGADTSILPGFGAGNDTYNMLAGDDWVNGGMGNDTIYGGDGFDKLSFEDTHYSDGTNVLRGIVVNVGAGVLVDCWGGIDKFTSVEYFIGSLFNDIFNGGALDDDFAGLRGLDTFNGGAGSDWLHYSRDSWLGGKFGIVVDLEVAIIGPTIRGTVRDGFGTIDTTTNIENVVGTRYNDVFVGSRLANSFGGAEGLDRFDGNLGVDTVYFYLNYSTAVQTGINVDLTRTTGQILNDGYGNAETAISIENISGSDQGDLIKGSVGNNVIEGGTGRDTMTGAGGADTFVWSSRSELGQGDVVADFAAVGTALAIDRLQFDISNLGASATLHLVNGLAATTVFDTFIFNTATDILYWDPDGTGALAKIAIATLTGVVSLSAANFELV
jgi:serralysin